MTNERFPDRPWGPGHNPKTAVWDSLKTHPEFEMDQSIPHQYGLPLICELKSSIDRAGMYIFERKARFYARRHQRTANRLSVISPMIDARARKVAERLGSELYGDSTEVEAL